MAQVKTNSLTGSFELFPSPKFFPQWRDIAQPSVTVHYWQSWNGHRYLTDVKFPSEVFAYFSGSTTDLLAECRAALQQLDYEDTPVEDEDPHAHWFQDAERVARQFEPDQLRER